MNGEYASDYLDEPEDDDPDAMYEIVDDGTRKQTTHEQDVQPLLDAQQLLLQAKTLLEASIYRTRLDDEKVLVKLWQVHEALGQTIAWAKKWEIIDPARLGKILNKIEQDHSPEEE